MEITKIFGPPGTGKTTALLNVVEDLLSQGVQPNRIAFTTFTRAGANEALHRACKKFNKAAEEFPYFKTLHAIAFTKNKKSVLNYSDMKRLSEDLDMPLTFGGNTSDGYLTSNYRGDHIIAIYNLARVTCRDYEEVFYEYKDCPDLTIAEVDQFADYYPKFKEACDKQDFTDMVENFVTYKNTIDVDYLVLDEAQDTKPLEWKMVDCLQRPVKAMWIGGDDDQSIHTWAGSRPEEFMLRPGKVVVLDKSYRVPEEVHRVALNIITKVTSRQEKDYGPRDAKGAVEYVASVEDLATTIKQSNGSWLLLARNRKMLTEYEAFCNTNNLLYFNPTERNNRTIELATAIAKWNVLINGGVITGADAKLVYKFMKDRDRIQTGSRTILSDNMDDDQLTDMRNLQDSYGLLWSGPWETAFITINQEEQDRMKAIQEEYGFEAVPSIEINTIHGSKGKEANNVVLKQDMSRKTFNGFQNNPDNEHRVFYVGVTRAIDNLFILNPQSSMHYTI